MRIELGRRSINIMYTKERINFKFFPRKFRVNAKKEYEFMIRLRKAGVCVPKPICYIDLANSAVVVREFIDGTYFQKALLKYPPSMIKKLLINIIKELRKIEDLKIHIPEMSTVYKNIIVSDTEPYIIDLERASNSEKPIIPQFLSRIWRLCLNPRLKQKLEKVVEIEKILDVARKYKAKRDLSLVLEIFIE